MLRAFSVQMQNPRLPKPRILQQRYRGEEKMKKIESFDIIIPGNCEVKKCKNIKIV